jgi:hypothetical protein
MAARPGSGRCPQHARSRRLRREAWDLCLCLQQATAGLMGADPETGKGMARIAGEIIIGQPVDAAFRYVAGQSNEPQYRPHGCGRRRSPRGPVKRSQFRSAVASIGRPARC